MDMLALGVTLTFRLQKSLSFASVEPAVHIRQSKNQLRLNF